MKILIIGGSGLVGGKLIKDLTGQFDVYATYSTRKQQGLQYLEIIRKDMVFDLFKEIKPDVVIHTAALTHVDYCEANQPKAWQINVQGTQNIAQACKLVGAKLIFISTDYIFDGQNGPYAEDDIALPICWYGKTKLEGERFIQKYLDDYLIIRTTGVFGFDLNSKNFIMQLLSNYKNNQVMKIPSDQSSNPILADNIASAIRELILKEKNGIYHIAGATVMYRYDFALKAADILGLDKKLFISVSTEELRQKAKRPKRGGLKIDKACLELETKLYSIEESLWIFKGQVELKEAMNE